MLDEPLEDSVAEETLERIRSACADVGFMVVTGHGISSQVLAEAREAAHEFFALPEAAKIDVAPQRWNASNANVYRGYFPSSADGKEGLDLGDPLIKPDMHDVQTIPYLEPNRLSAELDQAWHAKIERYFDAFFRLGGGVARAMVASLGGDPQQADSGFVRGQSASTLRFNFYPGLISPQGFSAEDGEALSCEAHVDSGLITILHQCDIGGLQVRDRKRRWHNIPPTPDTLVINTGRALQKTFGGAFAATNHRVLHSASPRLSIPFFFEPSPDLLLVPSSFGLDLAPPSEPVSYGTFLARSLAKFPEYQR